VSNRADIHLADLIRVMQALRPDVQTAQDIARLLGFRQPPPVAVDAPQEVKPQLPRKPELNVPAAGGDRPKLPPTASAAAVAGQPRSGMPLHIMTASSPAERPLPDWMKRPYVMPAALETSPLLPFEPLLRPQWTRALLTNALSSWHPEGAVDVSLLVEMLANGRAVMRLPRRLRQSLRAGVQLLVDRSEGMMQFARDVDFLRQRIRSIAGPERVEVLYFDTDPARCGRGSARTWRPWRPPAGGAVVAVLTDLGLGQPPLAPPSSLANTAQWQTFAAAVAREGCPLLAFVPYPRRRWPPELAERLRLVEWDRPTNIRDVHRLGRKKRSA
jgi:hypothetical protein